MVLARGPEDDICSARGCEKPACWAVKWNNPKIPRPTGKTWLACEKHRDFLENYLKYRQFPTQVIPFTPSTK